MQVFFYIFFKFFQPIIRKTITIINSYQNQSKSFDKLYILYHNKCVRPYLS